MNNSKILAAVLLVWCASSKAAEWNSKVEPDLVSAFAQRQTNDVMVQLAEQADLSGAEAAKTKVERGRFVINAKKAVAARSQPAVIEAMKARGMPVQAFWISNAISTRGTRADIEALARRSDVKSLSWLKTELPAAQPLNAGKATAKDDDEDDGIEPGLKVVHAPEVWALGFRGQGVVVGDHDIGVQWDHPALKSKYRGWDGATASHDYNWLNAFPVDPFCTDRTAPCDSHGHGTHTTGTMVGSDDEGNQVGMAPDARWIGCRSLLDPVVGVGTVPTYMTCMQWQLAPYPDGNEAAADPAMAPDVVNNSWGCAEGCAPPVLKETNDAIKAAGIVQVASAGNDGDTCSTLAFPTAVYESSFTVGATNNDDAMASFSSRGPVLSDASMRVKPNVTAPGVGTLSSLNDGGYGTLSGTSMASPHVAGLVALIFSAEPRLKGRVDEVRHLIEATAVKIHTDQVCGGTGENDIPNNIFGFGRVDALAAVLARPQLKVEAALSGSDYTVSVSQPAESKLDASNVALDIALPAGVTTADGAASAQFTHAKLAPGESWTETLAIKGSGAGITATAQADQVSPVMAEAKAARSALDRFGGAFGLGAIASFAAALLLRRRRRF